MKMVLHGICLVAALVAAPAAAQFIGPSAGGVQMTAADATAARPGTYVTLEGSITAHLREDYYTFRDASGEIRVEIEGEVFAARPVGVETRLRLLGEVDRGRSGPYVWVKTLDILP
jgi:uncharacterized protein (TIGR00156 family)